MRILLHDYGGYAFTIQLGRKLASIGHHVIYAHGGEATQYLKRGKLEISDNDPSNLEIINIHLNEPFQKYTLLKRRSQEIEYGHHLANVITSCQPDVVISANTPLDTQAITLKSSHQVNARFIFWLQDLIGIATYNILSKKAPYLGHAIGRYFIEVEKKLLRQSDLIIPIAEEFLPLLNKWKIRRSNIEVIPNWAPLEDIDPKPKSNPWSEQQDLQDYFVFMYSGVLGMKHNPDLLVELAQYWSWDKKVKIVVISEGPGADWLKSQKFLLGLDNLSIYDFQPIHIYPNVLGSADVLMAMLNSDAGVYSVPSKVLTYLAVKKPLLLSIPRNNLAARIVISQQAGFVVQPDDKFSFLKASKNLKDNPAVCAKMAQNGLTYARRNFDINDIAIRFNNILNKQI